MQLVPIKGLLISTGRAAIQAERLAENVCWTTIQVELFTWGITLEGASDKKKKLDNVCFITECFHGFCSLIKIRKWHDELENTATLKN